MVDCVQKGVMISHRNVISNVIQISTFEKPYRDSLMDPGVQSAYTDVALGLLPQSHIYALVVICHATTYRGDQVINLPKFELRQYLEAIQRFKINTLYLVSHNHLILKLYFRAYSRTALRNSLMKLYYMHVRGPNADLVPAYRSHQSSSP